MTDTTINIAVRPATMSEALPHAATRVRLAKTEQDDARVELMHARRALQRAEEHMARCDDASATAVRRLARLAETGYVDAYCVVHDMFYAFEPQVPKKPDGSVDHYTKPEDMWRGGAPPCPECARHDEATLSPFTKGVSEKTASNWML